MASKEAMRRDRRDMVAVYDMTEKRMLEAADNVEKAGRTDEAASLRKYAHLKFHDAFEHPRKFMHDVYWIEDDDCAYRTEAMKPKHWDYVIDALTKKRSDAFINRIMSQMVAHDLHLTAIRVERLKLEKAQEIIDRAVAHGDLVREGNLLREPVAHVGSGNYRIKPSSKLKSNRRTPRKKGVK